MYINTVFNIYNKYTLVTQFANVKNSAGILYFMLTLIKLNWSTVSPVLAKKSSVEFVFQHILKCFLKEPNPISAGISAPNFQCTVTSIKELFSPFRLSVFIGLLFLLRLRAVTGSRIHPQSCPRDAAEAFLHSRSKACLTGSFWSGRSREMLLFQDGNASTNSRKHNG